MTKDRKKDIKDAILIAVDNHLMILDSKIIYPLKKDGSVNETRLLAMVKSREKVYTNLVAMIDAVDLDRNNNPKLRDNIIRGMKTTFNELIEVVRRPMRNIAEVENEDGDTDLELVGSSDDIISSMSDSIKTASDLLKLINDRIAMLENPDAINEEVLNKRKIPSIPERYVKQR